MSNEHKTFNADEILQLILNYDAIYIFILIKQYFLLENVKIKVVN